MGAKGSSETPEWLTLSTLLDSLGAVLAIDGEARLTYVSADALSFLQREGMELSGQHLVDLVASDFREGLELQLAKVRQGRRVTLDCPFVGDSGEKEWARVAIAPGPEGAEGGALVTLTQIGDLKKAEIAVRESRALFDAVFENLPFECWVLDTKGNFVLQNPESVDRWGPVCTRTIDAVRLPEEILGDWHTDFNLASAGQEVRRDVIMSMPSGRKHFTRLLLPIMDGSEVLGVLGVCEETTARRNLEEQLAQSQKLDAVGRLAGGIAHDFNNILTAIMSCVRLLERRLEGPPRRELQIIREGAQRASELTRQLLAFAKQEMTEPRRTSVDEIVTKSDRLLRRLIGEDIDLITCAEAKDWDVIVDPVRLEQAIINLVVNARDAMPKGGNITIRSCGVELTSAHQSADGLIPPGSYALISVQDTGVGMSEDTKARAFEPFFTTRQVSGGTGLGLSSVYGSVRQAKGYVTLDSVLGDGTIIGLYLPRAKPDILAPQELTEGKIGENPVAGSETLISSMGGSETILLVEDEDIVMSVTCQTLRMGGYTVLEARGLEDALRVARGYKGSIDLLLTDVVMPHGTGPDLATSLRRERPDIVVLFMSGYAPDRIDTKVDALHFLAKPFTPDRLDAQVRGVLDAKSSD